MTIPTTFDSFWDMPDLKKLIEENLGNHLKLHDHINPQFAKVLTTIGFDKTYTRASGISLHDRDGHEYLDFLSGYGVHAFGRNHPKIKQVLKDFLDLDFPNLIQMEAPLLCGLLAKKIIEIFGHGEREQVFFTSSGTEAVEGALKFARAATGRNRFLNLEHAFHGLTTGSLAVNGNSEFRDGFGELLPSDAVSMNDLETLEQKLSTREYAAFIFEPVQGKGIYIPEKNFLRDAAALCKKYGTLTIADEIQSGIGRTGKWLACEHFEIEPDIVTLSKALSGGMVQIGAINYRRWIYDRVFSRMDRCVVHSSTFGKNNLSMVSGLTSLEIIEEEKLLQNATAMGALLLEKLGALRQKHSWILDVRGLGLMIGIEFGKPEGFKKKMVWDAVHKIDKGLFGELIVMPLLSKHRILTQVSGHHQDIVKLIPPLNLNEAHVERFVNALDAVLSECDSVTGPILSMGKNLARHVVSSKVSA